MNPIWDALLQWLHRVGLHPDQDVVERAGSTVLDSATSAAQTVGQAASGMDLPSLLALAAALGWASGFRLYLVVFVIGGLGAGGAVDLPGGLQVLTHPLMLLVSGGLLLTEFLADKVPGVDALWDLLHSVLRVPAGAALAAGVFSADSATMAAVAALMGGTLAATSQAAKTTTRALINTSPEPFSNLGASLAEDVTAVSALWLALAHPAVFAGVLAVTVVLMWIVTWLLWRFLRAALRRLRGWMGAAEPAPPQLPKT